MQKKLRLSSSQSLQISLKDVKEGKAGLSKHRVRLLNRVPQTNDWARFEKDSISMKDIAFLTAKTGHEFAILKGKKDDILFHGSKYHCNFDELLCDMLIKKQLIIYGHSHPGEITPIPSHDDRNTLKKIGQKQSRLISSVTGRELDFFDNEFQEIFINNINERSSFGHVDI